MLDIKFIRENPEAVKENIRKKFQDEKLPLVDRVLVLDEENRAAITEASELRAQRNTLSKQVGMLMGQAKKDPSKLAEAEEAKGAAVQAPGHVQRRLEGGSSVPGGCHHRPAEQGERQEGPGQGGDRGCGGGGAGGWLNKPRRLARG